MQDTAPTTWAVGDVVLDVYANPAIVLQVSNGKPDRILQLVGTHRGRVTYAPGRFPKAPQAQRVTGDRADRARALGRTVWAEQGLRRSRFGL